MFYFVHCLLEVIFNVSGADISLIKCYTCSDTFLFVVGLKRDGLFGLVVNNSIGYYDNSDSNDLNVVWK